MQISDIESVRAQSVSATPSATRVQAAYAPSTDTAAANHGPAAAVELSEQARSVASAKAAYNSVPETRDDVISRIKSQVDNGTYQVSSKDIVEQMVRRAKADTLK